MKYLLLVMTDANYQTTEPIGDVDQWVNKLNDADKYVMGDRLEPAAKAKAVRVRNGQTAITNDLVSSAPGSVIGFDVIKAQSMDEATSIAALHPMAAAGIIEVRAFWPFENT